MLVLPFSTSLKSKEQRPRFKGVDQPPLKRKKRQTWNLANYNTLQKIEGLKLGCILWMAEQLLQSWRAMLTCTSIALLDSCDLDKAALRCWV